MRQYMKVDEKECKNNPLDVLEDVISDLQELELVTMAIADQGDQHTLIDPTQVWHIAHHLGLMHEALAKASEAICKGSGKTAHILEQIYTTHNYIDFSMKMMRKGAVAAPKDAKLVIPFNMRDGLIIARGKGNDDWNCSAPHGAGRLLSRSDAKELIDLEEYKESMKGIYSTSVGTGTIDESPMAYKDPKEILRLIEDTVEVEYFIRPVINLKATNSYDSSVEIDVNEEAD